METSIHDLPNEILISIFSQIDYIDILNCSLVCSRFKCICDLDLIWKKFCDYYWLYDGNRDDASHADRQSYKQIFKHYYESWGRYIGYYRSIKKAWNTIEDYTRQLSPDKIFQSLQDGLSEERLDELEGEYEVELPMDLRCSYRIHDGQGDGPGLLGTRTISGHRVMESLLDLETSLDMGFGQPGANGTMPLTLCGYSGISQFIALSDVEGRIPGTIFYLGIGDYTHQEVSDLHDEFIMANSFSEWLITFSNNLAIKRHISLDGYILRFLEDHTAIEHTRCFKVKVATCFCPELSCVTAQSHFFYLYRITLSMAPDAPPSESCQLERRHWYIREENGRVEEVDGPGVVGEYPIMKPGSEFTWVSSTTFQTPLGCMEGFFTMRNFKTSELFQVKCAPYYMKCPPYVTAQERRRLIAEAKKGI